VRREVHLGAINQNEAVQLAMGIEQEALDDTFDPRQLSGIDPMHDVTSVE
jgi:hypothetical protein